MADWPEEIVAVVGETEILKSAIPVPESGSVCGLPAALSVIVSVATRMTAAVGLKVALIVQLAPAASVDGDIGQLLDCAKSLLFVPVIVMFVMVKGALPRLVSVEASAELAVPTNS